MIDYAVEEAVATITIDRADRRNALDRSGALGHVWRVLARWASMGAQARWSRRGGVVGVVGVGRRAGPDLVSSRRRR